MWLTVFIVSTTPRIHLTYTQPFAILLYDKSYLSISATSQNHQICCLLALHSTEMTLHHIFPVDRNYQTNIVFHQYKYPILAYVVDIVSDQGYKTYRIRQSKIDTALTLYNKHLPIGPWKEILKNVQNFIIKNPPQKVVWMDMW